MKELINILNEKEVPWDIPVLPMKPETRRLLFEQAINVAASTGFLLPVEKGLVLAWKDESETRWFGHLAFRVWACSATPLTTIDLSRISEALSDHGVSFAAISGWLPFPGCEGFLDEGSSIHASLIGLRRETTYSDNVKILKLGTIPELWIETIVNHIIKSNWLDRHARDFNLNSEMVRKRRVDWIENLLREGDGFLTVVLKPDTGIGAYAVVPIDRSRQVFGGPVVAGINAMSGSIHEGFGFFRKAIMASFRQTNSMWDTGIIQYQPENLPVARIIARTFIVTSCTRYDIHWHGSTQIS